MTRQGADQHMLKAATVDAHRAEAEFDDARAWWAQARNGVINPIAAEVWAFDDALRHVLLVQHRWRGWGCPGGKVEPAETPRAAAGRELWEETSISAELFAVPAAVFVRSYRSDWAPTLGLSYVTVLDMALPVTGESHQPAAWVPLEHQWNGAFPEDRARIRQYAKQLADRR